jgi:excisionase family DNA binding protein
MSVDAAKIIGSLVALLRAELQAEIRDAVRRAVDEALASLPARSIPDANVQGQDALVVPPRRAAKMLGVSQGRIYELIRGGVLQSYRSGKRARRITVGSINKYIASQVAISGNSSSKAPAGRPHSSGAR